MIGFVYFYDCTGLVRQKLFWIGGLLFCKGLLVIDTIIELQGARRLLQFTKPTISMKILMKTTFVFHKVL